ncbi:poly-beta-1,6 N-acetyl-D-glucosamine export porin PgaA [Enterobacter hormaechei subsp. xiangfangensis]|uniref:poly-beta-1,6 N-acetyl-D-glucosamine export porin PgaA n=1 Tax=Enterobacter hormaechei TaxID=158836 RepID=UPI000E2FE409|nr:poly-beta-1,6 N-acetyl-D-glucosamine export porin PgaA [Enterobacter hormaechei]ELT0445344.1 poly-beta-1,6 N-acetyl-D-glucosamine export porin PgaA [Enterobacter hormaechei subsp. xiangfangensis]ELX8364584.1 poly-beta-1,6 N-acetyl-D-glucosamine export porin PgaA [Enterobacter hormaechei]MBT1803944.1 poly-beta-1,6 N-acetyl-D-glucosamine export porin PgaA [Enterobacter hormaechei subsp. xiangfangensis]MBT2205642.1 poly-beta-1,6 N-acetyl-D-glucosamine export porin PgaA [Enterobacter hormaechei 
MERSLSFTTLFFYRTTILLFLLLLFPVLVQADESVYEHQIQQARNGNYALFLDYLQRYEQQHALTPGQVADWLQVASWAGRDDEVIRVWQRYGIYMPLPARAIAAVAQSRRNQKAWPSALSLWKEALSLAPDNDDYRIGYVKTLADARKDRLALSEARQLVKDNPSPAHLETLSYIWMRQGKNRDRLLADMRALSAAPGNEALLRETIDALTDNRVSTPALWLSQNAAMSRAERRRLERNAAAERVRLADVPGRTEKERLRLAQNALDRYHALLSRWQNDPQAAEDVILARIDRLGALYAQGNYRQVISEYESLTAAQHPVSDWAIGWVISAYLQEKNTVAAFSLVQRYPHYASDPQDEEHALFYAWLDTGQYQAARRYVERETRSVPWTRYDFGSPTAQPNDRWLTGQSLKFNYLLATNALPEAEKLSYRLASTAPGNQGLQIDYAALLQARGLPRAAEQKLKRAETLEPTNLELEKQQAYVAMDLQEWRQMDSLADNVIARAPADRSARRLDRLRMVHHMPELRLKAGKGLHSDNPVSGSHDMNWDATLYGPPVADNWRLFAGTRYAQGNFDEGKGISRHLLGGVEWRPRDLTLEAELSGNRYHGKNRPGARLSTTYSLSDNWQVSGNLERLSRATPLRALRNGISANRGEGGVRWYQNERREYQFNAAISRFSDHNRRQEYTLSGKERLWQTPTLTLELEPGIAASKNSLRNTLYYNPARDLSVTAALSVDHEMYRHYDTLWSQQFVAGGGSYWQKNQSPGAVTLLGYGQRIQWNNVVDTGVMLNWDKRPYDGKRESNLSVTLDATLRF